MFNKLNDVETIEALNNVYNATAEDCDCSRINCDFHDLGRTICHYECCPVTN